MFFSDKNSFDKRKSWTFNKSKDRNIAMKDLDKKLNQDLLYDNLEELGKEDIEIWQDQSFSPQPSLHHKAKDYENQRLTDPSFPRKKHKKQNSDPFSGSQNIKGKLVDLIKKESKSYKNEYKKNKIEETEHYHNEFQNSQKIPSNHHEKRFNSTENNSQNRAYSSFDIEKGNIITPPISHRNSTTGTYLPEKKKQELHNKKAEKSSEKPEIHKMNEITEETENDLRGGETRFVLKGKAGMEINKLKESVEIRKRNQKMKKEIESRSHLCEDLGKEEKNRTVLNKNNNNNKGKMKEIKEWFGKNGEMDFEKNERKRKRETTTNSTRISSKSSRSDHVNGHGHGQVNGHGHGYGYGHGGFPVSIGSKISKSIQPSYQTRVTDTLNNHSNQYHNHFHYL